MIVERFIWGALARRAAHQLALVAGALLFSLPFIWLLITASKQEEEIFVYPPELVPQIPGKVASSPWLDSSAYRAPQRPGEMHLGDWLSKHARLIEELEGEARRKLTGLGESLPEEGVKEFAEGIWERVSGRLPNDAWEAPAEETARRLMALAGDNLLRDILDTIRRRLVFGELQFASWQYQQKPAAPGAPVPEQWRVVAQGAEATVEPVVDAGKTGGLARYAFGESRRIVFCGEFALPFPAEEFKKLRLGLRADASWNALHCAVEIDGLRYVSRRPFQLRSGVWQNAQWQFESWEDSARALRPWYVLRPAKAKAATFREPGRVRVELALERPTAVGRVMGKLIENYREALSYVPFWRYFRSSATLVVLNILGELLGCSLAAFAFARLRWPGRQLCFVLMLCTLMIPHQVMMIPRFLIFRDLGWYNTWAPLWATSFFGNAFFIFMLTQFMRTIPTDLEDSARIDGCGYLRIYWNIILPLIKPSLAAIAIFTFMGVWNDFMGPLIYLADQRLFPLSLGLYSLQVVVSGRQGLIMAGSVLMTLPVIAIFFAAQRYFIQGVTLSGMKG